jgi:hypothetical protein
MPYVAVNTRDPDIQRHSGVPGSSLYLHPQHPDASRGVPVQVRDPRAAWAGSFHGRHSPYVCRVGG